MTLRPCLFIVAGLGLAGTASAQISVDPTANYLVGSQPSGMAMGDFDGDGDIDLASTVDGPDRAVTLLNNGTGTYVAGPAALLGSSTSPQDVESGDFNGDGLADLAVAVRDPVGAVVILRAMGGGVFTVNGTYAVGDRPRGLSIADLDGDGDLDIAVANRDGDSASVLTNAGGAFSVSTFASSGTEPRDTAFGDFDGDGDLDLAVTNHGTRAVAIFRNTAGSFAFWQSLSVGGVVRPDGVIAADLDGDGDVDIATATSNTAPTINWATIFVNGGGGAFSGPFNYDSVGQNSSHLVAADLNCDGLLDLAVSNEDSTTVALLANLGGAVYGPAMLATVGLHPSEINAADIDGDGDPDLATANRDSNDVSVIRNVTCTIPGDTNGDGAVGISDLLDLLSQWGACGGCSADFNGDGMVGFSDLLILLQNWS